MSAPVFLKVAVAGVIGVLGWALFGSSAKADPIKPPDPTPPPPSPSIPGDIPGACLTSEAIGAGWTIARVQSALRTLGVAPLKADGSCGPLTKAAIIKFQKGAGIAASGTVDIMTANAIDAKLKAKAIKDAGSEPVQYADGCNDGNDDAKESIKLSTVTFRDVTGKSEDYKAGYRSCFLYVIEKSGYKIDGDNVLLDHDKSDDGKPPGAVTIIGSTL